MGAVAKLRICRQCDCIGASAEHMSAAAHDYAPLPLPVDKLGVENDKTRLSRERRLSG